MTACNFRIKFRFPRGESLKIENHDLTSPYKFKIDDIELELKEKQNRLYHSYTITGGPFESETVASEYAEKLINGLYHYSLKRKCGIDFGNYSTKSWVNKEFFEKELGIKLENDNYGLLIYPANEDIKFIGTSEDVTLSLQMNFNYFIEEVNSGFNVEKVLTEKESTTLTLYNNAFFEVSSISRFLFLMITFESMLVFEKRSYLTIRILNLTQWLTRILVKNPIERESVKGSLEFMKNESIMQSSIKLINKYISEDELFFNLSPIKFFKICYSLRSDIVHNGKKHYKSFTPDKLQTELSNLVTKIITRKIYHGN